MSRVAADRGPGIRCYAPVIFTIALLIAWGLNKNWSLPIVAGSQGVVRLVAGWLLILVGILLSAAAFATLMRARTTFMPDRAATTLVVAGPFAFSRNPIYVGNTATYIGIALVANMAWPVLLLPLVWIVMRTYIIAREERHLAETFGPAYEEYRRRVRRWI